MFLNAQNNEFECINSNYAHLEKILGTWEVKTKDRTSPGNYENNTGRATITAAIAGCGISISYLGTFKGKPCAREISVVGLDSNKIQMATLDSGHGAFSIFDGSLLYIPMKLPKHPIQMLLLRNSLFC